MNDEFSVGLDLESKTSDRDKAMLAFQRAIAETKRKREKRQEQYCEERYLNSLSIWIWLNQMVQDNEPDPDDEWNPAFRGYIQARAAAKEQLIESETRRMMLNG